MCCTVHITSQSGSLKNPKPDLKEAVRSDTHRLGQHLVHNGMTALLNALSPELFVWNWEPSITLFICA